MKKSSDLELIRDEFCENECKLREKAFECNKDPDDAEKWLDMNYCSKGCPMMMIGR